ncbi:MAG: phage tail tape measure protein [Clostridia bacterium]|nr:phage tail tape measure protein [Clostridia bacterium]
MAENLGASFSIDVTNLKSGLKKANALIRESESEFKAAAAGISEGWDKTEDGLNKKLKSLNDIIGLQEQKVNALKSEYTRLINEGLDPTSEKAINLRTSINKEEEALNKNKTQAEKTRKALDELGDEEEDVTKKSEKAAGTDGNSGIGAMTVALGNLASTIATKALGALKDLAGAAADAYTEFDKGWDNVIKGTGATGEETEDLKKQYTKVSKSIVADSDDIGNALAEVSTRFGFTGDALSEATTQFMKFSELTGTDAKTAVQLVSRAMENAGIASTNYSQVLDQLYSATAASGISVDKLTENLTKYGAQLKSMGLDTETAIALFAQFEKSGVNTETVFKGLQKATSNWTKEGKDSRKEFENLITDIKKSPSDTAAGKKAIEVLGSKAGPELASAVREGRFEYQNLLDVVQSSKDKVSNVFEETQSGLDKLKKSINNVMTDIGTDIDNFVSKNKDMFESIGNGIESAASIGRIAWNGVITAVENTFLVIESAVKTVGSVLESFANKWSGFWQDVGSNVYDLIHGDIDYDISPFGDNWAIQERAYQARLSAGLGQAGREFATGGIVRHATNAIVGEAGAEAIIPLERNLNWLDALADRLSDKIGGGVSVYQTNNYSQAHSRYEIYKSQQATAKAVKLALTKGGG